LVIAVVAMVFVGFDGLEHVESRRQTSILRMKRKVLSNLLGRALTPQSW
jgi:hypothetical protein